MIEILKEELKRDGVVFFISKVGEFEFLEMRERVFFAIQLHSTAWYEKMRSQTINN